MERRRRYTQALRAAWHGRIVDWLNVDAMKLEEPVAGLLAQFRIANMDWNDVGLGFHHRKIGLRQHVFGKLCLTLMHPPLFL